MSPALTNFAAGIAASAAVTFLTAAPNQDSQPERYAIASIPWFVLAGVLTALGAVLEKQRQDEALATASPGSSKEREPLVTLIRTGYRRRLRLLSTAGVVTFIAALLMVPLLFVDKPQPNKPGGHVTDSVACH